MSRVLIIEDDVHLREELVLTFSRRGYETKALTLFTEAGPRIAKYKPDLLVLDLTLPAASGFALCRWVKARYPWPILVLTARDTLTDELKALELGADDFLTKPCQPERLLARAERLIQTYSQMKNTILCKGLSLDKDTFKLVWSDRQIVLTATEGKILSLLLERHPGVVSHADLLAVLWGTDQFVDDNILPVNIARLRKSLAVIGLGRIVRTVRGQGYRLEPLTK